MNQALKRLTPLLWVLILTTSGYAVNRQETISRLRKLSLPQLESELSETENKLRWLAPHSLRSGIGVIGYRSERHGSPDRKEWIEIQFDEEYLIDEIALVPTLWRDTHKGFRSDGFPRSIRILVGTDDQLQEDSQGKMVAEYGTNDEMESRIGPLVIPIEPTNASWVRIEATRLSTRAYDGEHVFQLSEVFVFSGTENVALRQKVQALTNSRDLVGAWDKQFLVDGHTPYLMDSSEGDQSLAYVSRFGEQPVLELDLESQHPIDRIHLHAVDQDDTVPQAYAGDLGIPNRLKIEGALNSDFSDAKTLLDYQRTNINDIGPIMMWRIPQTTCRFIRMIAVPPDAPKSGGTLQETPFRKSPRDTRIGFAEIEFYSKGRNVSRDKTASADYMAKLGDRPLSALTDGRNLFGKILPTRTWLNELAQRHDLEAMRPLVDAELSDRYAKQQIQLKWVTWLAACLAIGIGMTFLVDRIVRMRQLSELRTRFAADLHDELGADLHVIGLLSDLSRAAVNSEDKHESIHQRIRVMTERSSNAVRYCTNMLEAKGLYGDLLDDMNRSTERIMADFVGEFTCEDDDQVLLVLKPRTRADLFLFYKECLVNISRHSNATHFSAHLTARPTEIHLVVCDDGHGLAETSHNAVPASLSRRASLLGANVTAQPSDSGGTQITLTMSTRRWGFRK